MSLLLDALKKAEAEKKQQQTKKAADSNSHHQQDIDLDLDLDREDQKIAEAFPEVSEPSLDTSKLEDNFKPTESSEAKQEHEHDPGSEPQPDIQSVNEVISSNNNNFVEQDTPDNSTRALTEIVSDESADVELPVNETLSNETQEVKPEPEATRTPYSNTNNADRSVERSDYYKASDQDLAKLIDTANSQHYKSRFKSSILLFTFIIFILLVAILYFYVQNITSQQELYLSNTQNIQRTLPPVVSSQVNREQGPANPQNTSVADTKAKAASTHAVVSKAPASKASSLKKVTNQLAPGQNTNNSQTINVVQSVKTDPIESLLISAYQAFNNADYATSEDHYEKALTMEPNNRDARLGLSAIAIQNNNPQVALEHYRYLLKLNAKDTLALAGLANLNDTSNFSTERQLKLMLREQPETSHLHFALGNYYARQARWKEAQTYYFNAWSFDNQQIEYAYNLAVSLDHLTKYSQALKFYELSINLQQGRSHNQFVTQDVIERISSLREALQ